MKPATSAMLLIGALLIMGGAPDPSSGKGPALPFPDVPSASKAGPSLKESTHHWRKPPHHVAADAPNVVIIMLDDVGFGQAGTFGGAIHTPTLSRIAETGVSYNAFHTTALCSPTRAALLTGRNHHRVGNGVITEMAADWEGYIGTIPRSTATAPRVLSEFGYNTAAFGKWHNTPAIETTAMGPFTHWPTGSGVGFSYFYGFLAGETSQWEPRLVENLNPIEPPRNAAYHLSADLADHAVAWLRQHRAYTPDKPFFVYFAPGAGHGPHHVAKQWADKYKGRFDGGWDKLREEIFARQKSLGFIPADAQLTPRPESLPSWDSIPPSQRAFQTRLMEVFAGFVEHADVQAGRIIDELERQGVRDNTLVFYLFGDNGAATAGQNGSISELIFQNKLPSTVEQQMKTLDSLGGLDVLGSAKTDNIYHAAWGWAGNTPFQYMKQVASHLGGMRNPMAVSWPAKIRPDKTPRPQFTHVNDVVPTIYEAAGIKAPKSVDGFAQEPIDGVSFAYTFNDPKAAAKKHTQYFEIFGNRAIYHDGWLASALGPLQVPEHARQGESWDPAKDTWELYDLSKDYSQATNLAAANPAKLSALTALFTTQAKANRVFPIGGSMWYALHPEDRVATPYKAWSFDATTRRMPEFTAPGLGRESNRVALEVELTDQSSGVLYALGGFSGGLSLFMDEGKLAFEYNAMMIERYSARSQKKVPPGKHNIEVLTTIAKPGAPALIVIKLDGAEVARLDVKQSVPLAFTASESFDVGVDLGSPVSPVYFERRPFAFTGKIGQVKVELARQ
jgi:arylsulfatase